MAAAVLATATPASGYLVGFALPLKEVVKKSDLVVKATVVAAQPVKDPWFKDCPGFEPLETTLKVVSVIKGTEAAPQIRFRHYARKAGDVGYMYMPQHYSLALGRTYLVFAAKGSQGAYRQLWPAHTTKEDQGLFLAADDKPHTGKIVSEAVWNELTRLAKSETATDVVYAIQQLDQLSSARPHELHDFDRAASLKAVAASIGAKNAEVAVAAISAVGSDSPYLDDAQAEFWLAGMGRGVNQGVEPRRPSGNNLGADENRAALLAVANGSGTAAVRALAIRALGRGVPSPPLPDSAKWLAAPEPLVRQAAVVLLADTPGEESARLIAAAAKDRAPEVRVGAARAIGFGQSKGLLPILGPLLKDSATPVRQAAAMSLLSFDVRDAAETLKANLDSDFHAIFVNALARKDPKPYLAALGEIIEKQLEPKDFWGGRIPAGDAWDILFKFAKAQPATDLKTGKLDSTLDALEKQHWTSSSEPRDLYALYLLRGLPERAKRFRAACRKLEGFNMDTFFDMADQNPSIYVHDP